MKALKILLLMCLMSNLVQAQYVVNNKRNADVYFQNKEYYAAAEYYKKALQIKNDSAGFVVPYAFDNNNVKKETTKRSDYEYCVYQLATSLRLYKDYRGAEAWYALAKNFSDPKYFLSSFFYGECLRANEKYLIAITAFKDFLNKNKSSDLYSDKARTELASCNFALYEIRYPRLYRFSKIFNEINSKGSNYTPVVHDNNFFFTSSRPVPVGNGKEILQDKKTKSKVIKKENPYLNAIYEASGNPQEEGTTVKRIGAIEKGREFAAPAFNPNGKVMYLTSWTAKGIRRIFEVNIQEGNGATWSAPKDLGNHVNIDGYNSMQPFVTKDGKYLIFSSDRPGGMGKYDLWYCSISENGSMGPAINMGNLINTKEDEEAAYYNIKTRRLLYSSAGKIGLGGLDFYESMGSFSGWSEPRNLGYPFNSSKDDVYFTPIGDNDSEGYISSDRESVCCLEMFYAKKEFITIEGTILDCQTGLPLPGATVTMTDSIQQIKVIAGQDGKYKFRINSNRGFKLLAEKNSYFKKGISYSYEELSKIDTLVNPRLCLSGFVFNKPIVLKDILYDFNSANLNPGSTVILDQLYKLLTDNSTMEIELSAHTDNIGKAAYNLDLSDRRAKSCVDYLVMKGIEAKRMTSKGYGFSKPVAPNQFPNGEDNFLGRQQNRRTEFKITKM